MRVLVLGATGFIGRHVVGRLMAAGHRVTAAARDTAAVARRFPTATPQPIDLNLMTTPESCRPPFIVPCACGSGSAGRPSWRWSPSSG